MKFVCGRDGGLVPDCLFDRRLDSGEFVFELHRCFGRMVIPIQTDGLQLLPSLRLDEFCSGRIDLALQTSVLGAKHRNLLAQSRRFRIEFGDTAEPHLVDEIP